MALMMNQFREYAKKLGGGKVTPIFFCKRSVTTKVNKRKFNFKFDEKRNERKINSVLFAANTFFFLYGRMKKIPKDKLKQKK